MKRTEIGRLALRVEGEFWNAYWAPRQDSMEGAILLASIRMSLVADGSPVKGEFMELAKNGFSQVVRDITGGQIARWNEPRPAPERERSRS